MCTYPVQPVCTSLLFILLFIKSQYTVFAHLICFALFILLHVTLYFTFLSIYIYALVLCYFYIIFIFILLHCPLSGPDLIHISLLIIPCIIYYVTNKETLTLITSCRHGSCTTAERPDPGSAPQRKPEYALHLLPTYTHAVINGSWMQ